jgi:hypothetical protein
MSESKMRDRVAGGSRNDGIEVLPVHILKVPVNQDDRADDISAKAGNLFPGGRP